MQAEALLDALIEMHPLVQYAAIFGGTGEPVIRERIGAPNGASGDSDRWEELVVNPTLLDLARRRGEVDCGGLEYLLIRYGNFHQLILPLERGHVSVSFDLGADPASLVPRVKQLCTAHGARLHHR